MLLASVFFWVEFPQRGSINSICGNKIIVRNVEFLLKKRKLSTLIFWLTQSSNSVYIYYYIYFNSVFLVKRLQKK